MIETNNQKNCELRVMPELNKNSQKISDAQVYHSVEDLVLERANPPDFIQQIRHTSAGYLILPHREQHDGKTIYSSTKINDALKIKIFNFPGLDPSRINIPMFEAAITEAGHSAMSDKEMQNITAVYSPKFKSLDRYFDILEYYKNETFVGMESQHIAKTLLLPFFTNSQVKTDILLKAFSIGGHELKMAFTYVIQQLLLQQVPESEIKQFCARFFIYSSGSSLNWSDHNPYSHLYPRITHVLAIEDQGIKHLARTTRLVHANPELMKNRETLKVLTRDISKNESNEIVIVPPLGMLPNTPKDKCHNVRSYSQIIQNSWLKQFVQNHLQGEHKQNDISWKRHTS